MFQEAVPRGGRVPQPGGFQCIGTQGWGAWDTPSWGTRAREHWCPYKSTAEQTATEAFKWSLKKFIPQKEKWHTCLSTAPGSVQEEENAKLVPVVSGAPAAAGCFLSHKRGSRNEKGKGLLRGSGQGLGKGFGNWNLWGFLLTKRWEGERLILETWHFNQIQSRWGTSCTVSFLAFHVWVQRPQQCPKEQDGTLAQTSHGA